MLNVSDETMKSYIKDGKHKVYSCMIITYDSEADQKVTLNITNDQIKKGSIKVKETLMSSSINLEFVGGNASSLEIEIYGLGDYVAKGAYIQLEVSCDDTESIRIFTGFVDSAKKDAARRYKKIVAYDILYFCSNFDISGWYNDEISKGSGKTIYQLTTALIERLRVELQRIYAVPQYQTVNQVFNFDNFELVNGNLSAELPSNSKLREMSCLDLLKHIAQINACFVRVNRKGQIEFKYLTYNSSLDIVELYPANDIYPSNDLYPGHFSSPIGDTGYYFNDYEQVVYEDFSIKPIENVVLRDSENDENATTYYGNGVSDYNNQYIIQGNLFLKRITEQSIRYQIAETIYSTIKDITFVPFDTKNRGLPFLECGDEVIYKDLTTKKEDKNLHFYIMRRNLSGDQVLKDVYEASGDETQWKFVSSLSAQIEQIRNESSGGSGSGSGSGNFDVQSVDSLPEDAADHPNTIYLIRGNIMMA